ncbi:glycine--tRNA ligase subunit beta [Sediminibacillus dalangtanensis]|uniref:Glycine--tRNA ligase beta subunit n=1 Tax=Sediminibacillus dalangtanensis TaxID=2729421 RepID=A0ABX7VTJ3_9BACI|nr:glycine--tRNA ligase subunit beta [Sediminibacillus dalangtanensis]QTM99858.1 glycine--tRNA ligase subunit beta [Sediminibacillus dalangtanensis]
MTTTNILFEIGLEEMPARFLDDAQKQLHEKTTAWLDELRVPYQGIEVYVTPRRLAVVIKDAAEKQPDIEEEAKGPAKSIALDENGEWTKAAVGFSRGQGKTVKDIYTKEVNGTEYIFVRKFIEGRKTLDLLQGFKDVVLKMNFPKSMRWSDLNLRYVRPIRWITALFGSEIVPLEIAGVTASNITYGHRFLGESIELSSAEKYRNKLKDQYVIVKPSEREEKIRKEIEQLQEKKNWKVPVDADLLDEVKHLVEYPTVFSGSFDEEFLEIPEEALITSMKEHQRYFPVRDSEGSLLPNFVAVRNGNSDFIETVARGNEKVLRARLSDARFFFEEDKKQSIASNVKKLEKMVFQEKLGTIADKVSRVTQLTGQISDLIDLDALVRKRAVRAAEISKFDLVTNMVNEFTELQGIMGEKYALLFGENEQTAKAINEHYMPRHAGDTLPASTEGALVSVADKLDTIIGCISVGIIPSGSQDPYGLRRQAIGVLQILKNQNWQVKLEQLLEKTYQQFEAKGIPTRSKQETLEDVSEFFTHRAGYIMKEAGIDQDVIEAVLHAGIGIFQFTFDKALVLADKRQDESFKSAQEGLGRVLNLAGKTETREVKKELFENDTETELNAAVERLLPGYQQTLEQQKAKQAIETLAELAEPIHAFFDHTMVMAKEEKLKNNRLALLNKIATMVYQYADLSKVQWKQQF